MSSGRPAGRKSWFQWVPLPRVRIRHSLSFYLTILLLVAIVPPFVFAMAILKRSADDQDRVLTTLLKSSTGSVTRVVERETGGMLTTLRILSTSSTADARRLPAFHQLASAALSGTESTLSVIDRSYNQLLNTRVPFGTTLLKTSDPSIEQAFLKGGPLISNVFFSKTGKRWVYNVYLPVTTPLGNNDYLLALTRDASSMAKAVGVDALSPGWKAALLDRTGRVIASSDKALFPGQSFFMTIASPLRAGIADATQDGVLYKTVSEVSGLTGWQIVAWAKSADVAAPAFRSYLWLSMGGLLFAAIAVAGSLAIARLLAQGIKLLAHDAHLLGDGRPVVARRHRIIEIETVSRALSEAAQARRKAENEIRFLMREVAHRSKNQLTVIQSMLNQSVAVTENPADFAEAFRRRVAGLSRSTDLMIANASQGVDFRELAQNQLQPFIPDDPARVRFSGPPVRLDAQVSQTLGMALHELATNGTKYGALANSRGVIDITWSLSGDVFLLVWRETGADIKTDEKTPPRKGFGSMVLERMLRMALDASLDRILHEDGIEWRVSIPRGNLYTDPAITTGAGTPSDR